MTFHGKERFVVEHQSENGQHAELPSGHLPHPPKESPWVVTVPLTLLGIASVVIGWLTIQPLLYGDFFGSSIFVAPQHHAMQALTQEFHGAGAMVAASVTTPTLWLALAGLVVAWVFYIYKPAWPAVLAKAFNPFYQLLMHKFYFDEAYAFFIEAGSRALGRLLWIGGDGWVIDGIFVDGSARAVGWFSRILRRSQTGYLYHYAFVMIIGLCVLLGWLLLR